MSKSEKKKYEGRGEGVGVDESKTIVDTTRHGTMMVFIYIIDI